MFFDTYEIGHPATSSRDPRRRLQRASKSRGPRSTELGHAIARDAEQPTYATICGTKIHFTRLEALTLADELLQVALELEIERRGDFDRAGPGDLTLARLRGHARTGWTRPPWLN